MDVTSECAFVIALLGITSGSNWILIFLVKKIGLNLFCIIIPATWRWLLTCGWMACQGGRDARVILQHHQSALGRRRGGRRKPRNCENISYIAITILNALSIHQQPPRFMDSMATRRQRGPR